MKHNQTNKPSRFGLFGDIPTRILVGILKNCPLLPFWIEAPLIYLASFFFFLIAKSQRDGIRHNLGFIYSDLGCIEAYFRSYMVFANFAFTYVDGQRAKLGQDVIQWELEGSEHFDEMNGSQEGALLFTTHTGNYDLAATLFTHQSIRTLHTVRLAEKNPHMQKLREQEFLKSEEQHPNLKILYNRESNMLGIELLNLLNDNKLVAVQGDRVMEGISSLSINYSKNAEMLLPKGPLTLACVSKCQCFPLFIIRSGYRKYTVICQPALDLTVPAGQRRLTESDVATQWVIRLKEFLDQYAEQWFVLEKHFRQK